MADMHKTYATGYPGSWAWKCGTEMLRTTMRSQYTTSGTLLQRNACTVRAFDCRPRSRSLHVRSQSKRRLATMFKDLMYRIGSPSIFVRPDKLQEHKTLEACERSCEKEAGNLCTNRDSCSIPYHWPPEPSPRSSGWHLGPFPKGPARTVLLPRRGETRLGSRGGRRRATGCCSTLPRFGYLGDSWEGSVAPHHFQPNWHH